GVNPGYPTTGKAAFQLIRQISLATSGVQKRGGLRRLDLRKQEASERVHVPPIHPVLRGVLGQVRRLVLRQTTASVSFSTSRVGGMSVASPPSAIFPSTYTKTRPLTCFNRSIFSAIFTSTVISEPTGTGRRKRADIDTATLPCPGKSRPSTLEIIPRRKTPWTIGRPKRVCSAYSSSTWIGLSSPVTAANTRTSSAVMTRFTE